MSPNNRWSPYPDSMLDIPRDVSFFEAPLDERPTGYELCERRVPRREPMRVPRQPEPAHDFVPDDRFESPLPSWSDLRSGAV